MTYPDPKVLLATLGLLFLAAAPAPAPIPPPSSYVLANTFHLSPDGHFARVTPDADGKILYLLESGKTQVLDAATGKSLADFPSDPGARSLLLIPEAHRGVISNGWHKSLTLFDLSSNVPVATLPAGQDAECLVFDPVSKLLFTSSYAERSLASIDPQADAKNLHVNPSLKLDGRPVSMVTDNLGILYIATLEPNEIAVVDARSMKIATTWPLDFAPGPLAIDRLHSRLFIGTRGSETILSTTDGHQLAELPLKAGVSSATFAYGKLFVSSPESKIDIIAQNSADDFAVIESLNPAAFAVKPNPDNAPGVNPLSGAIYLPQVEPHDSSWQSRPLSLLVLEKKEPTTVPATRPHEETP